MRSRPPDAIALFAVPLVVAASEPIDRLDHTVILLKPDETLRQIRGAIPSAMAGHDVNVARPIGGWPLAGVPDSTPVALWRGAPGGGLLEGSCQAVFGA